MSAEVMRHPAQPEFATARLLAVFLGAPVAWAVHLAASYFFVALDCGTAWNGGLVAILVATVFCAVAAAWTGSAAWREWKRLRGRTSPEASDLTQAREFLALSGALLAMLFTGAILLAGLSPLFLPMCG
jgi:hypothetical protein